MEVGFFLKRQWTDLSVFEYVVPYTLEFELELLVNEATNLFNAWGVSLLSVEWKTVLEPWVNYDNTYLIITLSLTHEQIVALPRETPEVIKAYEKFMRIITPETRTFERKVEAPPKVGIWFVYFEDLGAHPLYVSMDELDARRWADTNGYGDVMFWESGTSWDDFKKQTKIPQIVLDPAYPGL